MKFIHCADLHLDTAFSGLFDEKQAEIRQAELRRTFLAIIERAKKADALFISGDLFDQSSVEAETIRVLQNGFASLENTQVFIAAGNHDFLAPKSYYCLAEFSPNVHVFGESLGCVAMADCDVYGISFSKAQEPESLLSELPAVSDRPAVLVIHGSLGGTDYNPMDKSLFSRSGFSYVALGHEHSFRSLEAGKCLCVYPGCPEGRGFDELDEKGIVEGVLDREGVRIEFVPLCSRQYREISVDISLLSTHEAVLEALLKQVKNSRDLYKFILTGETDWEPHVHILSEGLKDCFYAKIYDRTRRSLYPETLAKEPGVRGLFAEKLLREMTEEREDVYRRALSYGLSALSGEKVKPL